MSNTKGREAKKANGIFLHSHEIPDRFIRDYIVRLCDDGAWDEVAKTNPSVAKALHNHRDGMMDASVIIMHCTSHAMAVEYYCFHHLACRLWDKDVVSVNMEPSKAKCFIVTALKPEGYDRTSIVMAIGPARAAFYYAGISSAQEYEAGVFYE